MSVNTQFPELSDSAVERWKKVSVHAITGIRLDPYTEGRRMPFLLESKEKNFSADNRTLTFSYEDDVIELYSAREVTLFRALNKYLFEQGLIAPYESGQSIAHLDQVFTDSMLHEMLTLRKAEFIAKLATIDSWVTIGRLLPLLRDTDPQWKREAIQNRQSVLSPK